MNKFQKLRMRRLIKMLNNLKSELPKTRLPGEVNEHLKKFDMSLWTCGTSACALGIAACHPYFQKQGLTLKKALFSNEDFIPNFEEVVGFDAAERFFGISPDEAADIFSGAQGARSNTPRAVAKRAQAVLDSYK